jgi:hypothetical protein
MGWDYTTPTTYSCGCVTYSVSHDSFFGSHTEREYCDGCYAKIREEQERRQQREREEQERRDNTLHTCAGCKREVKAIDMGYTTKRTVYKKCPKCRGPPRPRDPRPRWRWPKRR